MAAIRKSATLRIDDLIQLLGERATLRLLKHYSGRKLPSPKTWLIHRRRQNIVADYRRGYPDNEIAAKYKMPLQAVRKTLTEELRALRRQKIETGQDPWITNLME